MKIAPHKEVWIRKGTEERIAQITFEKIKSIAVIKHGALGDLVQVRPMLLTLRRYFPNATLTISAISHFTRGIPEDLVDRVHITKGKDKKYSEREKWQSMRELGEHDIIFDITQTSRSHWLTLLNPAKLKIGFKHKGLERFVYDIAINRAHYRFEAETFLEQLNAIALDYQWPLEYGYEPIPPVIEGDYILYFPTASEDNKVWSHERIAAFINRAIREHTNYKHVLLTGIAEWEKTWVKEMVTLLDNPDGLQHFQGGEQSEAIVANAYCVVANDTGIRNLAIVHGTPTLGIFPNGILFGYMPHFGLHEAAYTMENSHPEVEDTYKKFNTLLERISATAER